MVSSTVRSILGRTTQQAVFGLLIVATTCYLAVVGDISGEAFLGLGAAVAGYLFRSASA